MLECPVCHSNSINQYRTFTGPIWCGKCGYKVENKEQFNPFIKVKFPSFGKVFAEVNKLYDIKNESINQQCKLTYDYFKQWYESLQNKGKI